MEIIDQIFLPNFQSDIFNVSYLNRSISKSLVHGLGNNRIMGYLLTSHSDITFSCHILTSHSDVTFSHHIITSNSHVTLSCHTLTSHSHVTISSQTLTLHSHVSFSCHFISSNSQQPITMYTQIMLLFYHPTSQVREG